MRPVLLLMHRISKGGFVFRQFFFPEPWRRGERETHRVRKEGESYHEKEE